MSDRRPTKFTPSVYKLSLSYVNSALNIIKCNPSYMAIHTINTVKRVLRININDEEFSEN